MWNKNKNTHSGTTLCMYWRMLWTQSCFFSLFFHSYTNTHIHTQRWNERWKLEIHIECTRWLLHPYKSTAKVQLVFFEMFDKYLDVCAHLFDCRMNSNATVLMLSILFTRYTKTKVCVMRTQNVLHNLTSHSCMRNRSSNPNYNNRKKYRKKNSRQFRRNDEESKRNPWKCRSGIRITKVCQCVWMWHMNLIRNSHTHAYHHGKHIRIECHSIPWLNDCLSLGGFQFSNTINLSTDSKQASVQYSLLSYSECWINIEPLIYEIISSINFGGSMQITGLN